eukprot:1976109-Rhodomonas_salina.2
MPYPALNSGAPLPGRSGLCRVRRGLSSNLTRNRRNKRLNAKSDALPPFLAAICTQKRGPLLAISQ